jgi:hypothetical protein
MLNGHNAVLANNGTTAAAQAQHKPFKIAKLEADFHIKIYVNWPDFLHIVRVATQFAYTTHFLLYRVILSLESPN